MIVLTDRKQSHSKPEDFRESRTLNSIIFTVPCLNMSDKAHGWAFYYLGTITLNWQIKDQL